MKGEPMIYSTKQSRVESLLRKIRNSVKEIEEAVGKLEKAQLFSEGTTSDLISRQAAIDALDCISGVEEVLRSLPSIQPERAEGEWIEISSINHTYKCSECGRLLINVADGRNNVSKHYPYCHCGADMRGEKNERTD